MEKTFSGYCRNIDGARIVLLESDGQQTDIDCDYGSCAYRAECSIGREITQMLEQTER